MAESLITNALQERLALYALGILDPEEAEEVEAEVRAEPSDVARELHAMEQVVEKMGYSPLLARPRPELRQQLLSRLGLEPIPTTPSPMPVLTLNGFTSIRSDQGEWVEFCPGVLIKTLSVDSATKRHVALVRMAAGTQLPPHQHLGDEEVFVISGDCHTSAEQVLYAGDYFKAAAGSWHEMTRTQEGTMFLTIFRNEFVG